MEESPDPSELWKSSLTKWVITNVRDREQLVVGRSTPSFCWPVMETGPQSFSMMIWFFTKNHELMIISMYDVTFNLVNACTQPVNGLFI